jgi:hypothetical protein
MGKDKKITDGQGLKEAFLEVFEKLGGVDGLLKWAGEDEERLKLAKRIIKGLEKLRQREK